VPISPGLKNWKTRVGFSITGSESQRGRNLPMIQAVGEQGFGIDCQGLKVAVSSCRCRARDCVGGMELGRRG
jgi:hypothetical protein